MSKFMEKLKDSAENSSNHSIKVINMQNQKLQGSLIFVPITPADGSDAICVLNSVTEVKDYYTYKNKEGKEEKANRWLKLLAKSDYGKLTEDEVEQYRNIKAKVKQLMNHKWHKDPKKNALLRKEWIRMKDYILLTGYIIKHTDRNGKILNKNTPAILVFSSAKFRDALYDAIDSRNKMLGSEEWQSKLFNRDELRKQFLSITYWLSDSKDKIGYITTVSVNKFDEDTIAYTDGKIDGLHMKSDEAKKAIEACNAPAVKQWLNLTKGSLFNDEYINNFDVRMDKYLVKFGITDPKPKDEPNNDDLPY